MQDDPQMAAAMADNTVQMRLISVLTSSFFMAGLLCYISAKYAVSSMSSFTVTARIALVSLSLQRTNS